VTLTIGTGPFGDRPGGRFNSDLGVPETLLYLEDALPRIRALFARETVVDSTHAKLLHESRRLPVYFFPRDDVRGDLLVESDRTEQDAKGEVRFWSIEAGGRTARDAVRAFDNALLHGYVTVAWEEMDEWFAEDEQLFGHPRDPYHRIDVYRSTRHVRVLRDGVLLAETRRPSILFETGLPPRYYIPAGDVRTDLLVPSSKRTRCAYKGSASYWGARVGDRVVEDLVWAYPEPHHDAEPVRDLLCFFNERVDLEVEGEPQERPQTQWSRDD
jgi:uncharacterized protein (DUF427 family)